MRREEIKIRIKNGNVLLLYIMMIIMAVCAAQVNAEPNQPEPNQPQPAQPEPNQTPDNNQVPVGQADDGMVIEYQNRTVADDSFLDQPVQCINFRKDMSIRDAIRFLAAKYHRNIIPSAQVTGVLSVTSLYDVTFEQALDAVLGSEYRYKTTGGFIRVYTADEYEKLAKRLDNMTSRVFELYYVNATDVKALITPAMSEFGKMASTTAAVVDTEAGKGGDTFSMRDRIVVYDFPERLEKISEIVKQVDVKPQQILVEVTILKATLTEDTEFGINWTKIAALTNSSFHFTANLSNSAATAFTADISNDELTAAITAQEDVTDATVLANPKIMALNKQAGYINIGNKTGYTESTTQTSTGTTSSIAFLDSGTILKFRPFICDNGYIRMEINPEESTASTKTITSGDNTMVIPSKTLTQVQTNIMVRDGKTIIIGGLFKEQLTSTDSQVPVVGDFPIVGHLFKSTSDENIRTELIILITPHLIKEPEDIESASEAKRNDISRIVDGSRKRISPIARVRIYEDCYAKAIQYYSDKKYDKSLAELNWIIGFRPDALEAVQLKEKILAGMKPDEYRTLERIMVEQIRKEQDVMWKRR